jgi:hypothetical protein
MAEAVGQRHTHHSFGSDTASHAGDQFAAHQAARSAFSWNFSITQCDAICMLAGIRPVADGPDQP